MVGLTGIARPINAARFRTPSLGAPGLVQLRPSGAPVARRLTSRFSDPGPSSPRSRTSGPAIKNEEKKMTETKSGKHPTHTIYKVVGDGEDGKWTKVGVGFTHKDGQGLALVFDGIPTEGRIAVRKKRSTKLAEGVRRQPNQGQLPIHLPVPKPVV